MNAPEPPQSPLHLLFVCMGNICRSPLAEGIFAHLAHGRGRADFYRLDSAGIGDWHVGQPADPRSCAVAEKHGITLTSRARQIQAPEDFEKFAWLFAMDRENLRDLQSLSSPRHFGKIRLIRGFDPEGGAEAEVPDPYYGGPRGFDQVYAMLERSCRGLLERLEGGGGLA